MTLIRAYVKLLLGLCLISAMSCATFFSTPIPMRVIHHENERAPGHDTLMIFLPGNPSHPDEFMKEQFVSILHDAYPDIDSVAVDASLGYYIKEMLPERLLEDVIKPARAMGYKKIWVTGISMGGSGALWYIQKYPATVQGIVLLAPFLGDKKIINEVVNAGGLKKWHPVLPLDRKDYQRKQMLWLKQNINPWSTLPAIYLGFGESDKFYQSNRLLADLLLPKQVIMMPGDHDWETWRTIFKEFMHDKIMH
jgi:pimeloyl-ACP methyl ester carboxylesterase